MLVAVAALALIIWLYLLLFHGRFWRADQRLGKGLATLSRWPEVVVIIPARNEAETIGPVLRAHLGSTYPGHFSLLLVDDQSDDGTGDIAREMAGNNGRPLHVLRAPDLRPGWTGKLAALDFGISKAAELAPDAKYVLFTDADIVHGPGTLTNMVTKAERGGLSLVSLMAKLDARGVWGNLLIPPFIFFFQKLYPFPRVNDPTDSMAGAAGGCVLLDRKALTESGGLVKVKDALIDDCALAALIKGNPPKRRIWLGLAEDVFSLRDNRSLSSIWQMVTRTAYTQLRYSPMLLACSSIGMALVYLAGPVIALSLPFHGAWLAAILGLASWIAMMVAYTPTLRDYGKPAVFACTLPVAAVLYILMTLNSAWRHWSGSGGRWKGRSYSKPGTSHPSTGSG